MSRYEDDGGVVLGEGQPRHATVLTSTECDAVGTRVLELFGLRLTGFIGIGGRAVVLRCSMTPGAIGMIMGHLATTSGPNAMGTARIRNVWSCLMSGGTIAIKLSRKNMHEEWAALSMLNQLYCEDDILMCDDERTVAHREHAWQWWGIPTVIWYGRICGMDAILMEELATEDTLNVDEWRRLTRSSEVDVDVAIESMTRLMRIWRASGIVHGDVHRANVLWRVVSYPPVSVSLWDDTQHRGRIERYSPMYCLVPVLIDWGVSRIDHRRACIVWNMRAMRVNVGPLYRVVYLDDDGDRHQCNIRQNVIRTEIRNYSQIVESVVDDRIAGQR